jgi:hypothetical protein
LNIKRNKTSLKPGEWFCPSCNILNFSVRTVCVRCFTEKPVGYDKNTESRGSRKAKYNEVKESKKNKERRVVKRSQSKEMKPLKDDMNHKRKNSGRSYHDDSSENSQKYEKKRRDNDLDKSNNVTLQTIALPDAYDSAAVCVKFSASGFGFCELKSFFTSDGTTVTLIDDSESLALYGSAVIASAIVLEISGTNVIVKAVKPSYSTSVKVALSCSVLKCKAM